MQVLLGLEAKMLQRKSTCDVCDVKPIIHEPLMGTTGAVNLITFPTTVDQEAE